MKKFLQHLFRYREKWVADSSGVRYQVTADGRVRVHTMDLILSPEAQAHYAEMERLYQKGLICTNIPRP